MKENKPFDFLQDHSAVFLEMAFKSDRMEKLQHPDGEAGHTGDCGDTVSMALKLAGGVIARVAFHVQGCLNTVASANAVAELVEGKPPADAWETLLRAQVGERAVKGTDRQLGAVVVVRGEGLQKRDHRLRREPGRRRSKGLPGRESS